VRGHEIDRLRGHLLGSHHEIPLVLAVGVIGNDDHAAGPDFLQDIFDRIKLRRWLGHCADTLPHLTLAFQALPAYPVLP
jgi:hypothetical protein